MEKKIVIDKNDTGEAVATHTTRYADKGDAIIQIPMRLFNGKYDARLLKRGAIVQIIEPSGKVAEEFTLAHRVKSRRQIYLYPNREEDVL